MQLNVTGKTSDEEILTEAKRVAYTAGIATLTEVVERLLKLERWVAQLEEKTWTL